MHVVRTPSHTQPTRGSNVELNCSTRQNIHVSFVFIQLNIAAAVCAPCQPRERHLGDVTVVQQARLSFPFVRILFFLAISNDNDLRAVLYSYP